MRALYPAYNGNLYQVTRASDSTTLDIAVTAAGAYANSAAQDTFCAAATCRISIIYDQSPEHNDLLIEVNRVGALANALPVSVGGHRVYGVSVTPGVGYRHTAGAGVATNGQPESMYMVASDTSVNGGCCFDYGNAERNIADTGAGHMDAINFSTGNGFLWYSGGGAGPWAMADLEDGVFAGRNASGSRPFNPANTGNPSLFATALLKNDGQANFAIKGGNASSGPLTTWSKGPLPNGYAPMHQEGSIVLGTGGDNSDSATGSFYEGVMTTGVTSEAADNSVQKNINSFYGQISGYNNVSVGADGTVIALASNDSVWKYNGSGWTKITGKLLTRVAVRLAGDIWGRATDGTIWRYTRGHHGGTWAKIAGNGTDIAAGSDGTIWRTDDTGTYKWNGGTSPKDPTGNWTVVPGSAPGGVALLVQASGKSATDLWGVGINDSIWHYNGTSWTQITGGLKWVSEGSDGTVEGVAPDNRVWLFTGVSPLPWTERPGPLAQLSVETINNVWGAAPGGNIVKTSS